MRSSKFVTAFPNLTSVLRNLRAAPTNVLKEVGIQMNREGEEIITNAKGRTPVDTGNLRASEFQRTVIGVSSVKTTVAAGGPSAPYAYRVHEDMQAYHRVGQAKYLELAVLDQVNSGMSNRIASAINKGFMKK